MKWGLLLLALLFSACADGQAGTWVEAIERANADADKAIAKRDLPVAIEVLTQGMVEFAGGDRPWGDLPLQVLRCGTGMDGSAERSTWACAHTEA